MMRIERLEQEIVGLTPSELAAFRMCFQQFDAAEWDKQIEEDILPGKLDKLARKAFADHSAGRPKEL
jgi:hypothetical protein